jgi:hypothetical protein
MSRPRSESRACGLAAGLGVLPQFVRRALAPTNDEMVAQYESLIVNTGSYSVAGSTITLQPMVAKSPAFIGDQATAELEIAGDTLTLRYQRIVNADGAAVPTTLTNSPAFNPIEQAFAKLKALLRAARLRSVDEVTAPVGLALDLFSPTECVNDIRNSPAFSPDGGLLAFSRVQTASAHDVMTLDLDGTGLTRLTTDRWGQVRGLDWWPDSESTQPAS